uniref:DNA pilot protein n=1 Tax=Dulem virus 201 TaxID=3145678 RepID=A0AAU8B3B6_9VIRU
MSIATIGMGLMNAMQSMMPNNSDREQAAREREMMGLQYQYNNQMAIENLQRAKDMWDYTNLGAQVQHAKEAGLSKGLLYANGGASGQSSGGQGAGVNNTGSQAVAMGLQNQALKLQNQQILSQTELNQAQAKKAEAEASKIAGVDTKQAEAGLEKLIAETSNEKIKRGLILADVRYKDAMEELSRNQADAKNIEIGQIKQSTRNLEKTWEILEENLKGSTMDNEVKKRTIETMVSQAEANLSKTIAEVINTRTSSQVGTEMIKDIQSQIATRAEQMAQTWRRVRIEGGNYELNKAKFEIEAEKIYQYLDIDKKKLGIEEQRLIKDFIGDMLKMGTQLYK